MPYFKKANRNYTNEQIKSSVAYINFYYNDLYYTLIEESPSLTPDILIGSIGRILLVSNKKSIQIV